MKKTNNPVAKYARDFNKAVVMKDRKKAQKKGDRKHKGKYQEDTDVVEDKKGLWDRIHAKRKRGEAPAKPGDKDYPKTLDVGESVEQFDEAKMGTVDKKTLKKLIDDVMNKFAICYAYNATFKHYYSGGIYGGSVGDTATPMPKEKCEKLVDEYNKCKGGQWVVHSKAQYEAWKRHEPLFVDDKKR